MKFVIQWQKYQSIKMSIAEYDFKPRSREKNPVSFWTRAERKVLPLTISQVLSVPPNKYDHSHITGAFAKNTKKVVSVHGYGGNARFAARFTDNHETTPAPGYYQPPMGPKTFTPCAKPFGIGEQHVTMKFSKVPGVGLYDTQKSQDRRMEFKQHFFKKELLPAVEVKCVAINNDICDRCDEKPVGDYWQYHHIEFLCRRCMEVLRGQRTARNYIKLESFKKIRDCSFMHSHEGTAAKVTLMDKKIVHKLQMREAYLKNYFK